MPLRIATLASAQLFDLATFMTMVSWHGPAAEVNPIVSGLFGTLGLPAVVLVKLALIVLVGSLAVAGAARDRRGVWAVVAGAPLAVAIAVGLVGGISNAAVILG